MGEIHDPAHGTSRGPQGDVATGLTYALGHGDDHAKAGDVHEFEPFDVEHDIETPVQDDPGQLLAEAGSVVDVHFAAEIDDHLAVRRVLMNLEVQTVGHGGYHFLERDGGTRPGFVKPGSPDSSIRTILPKG